MVARNQNVRVAVSAAVGRLAPLATEAEISLPPRDVPIVALAALVKVGVRVTVAPNAGAVLLARMEALTWPTTLTIVLDDFVVSSAEVDVMVTLPTVAGAVQTPAEVMVPALAVHVRWFVAPPLAVVLKLVVLETVRVGAAGVMAATTTVCGVTVTEESTASPAALVTCSQ